MKRTEILRIIAEKEQAGDFHAHITPPNKYCKEVKPNYDYMRKSFGCKVGAFFARPIFSAASGVISHHCKLKIYGKENLSGITGGAILTSNHINKIDCALIKHATKGHKVEFTVGEFNNFKGVFGSLLRSAGTMPFSSNTTCMRNLARAITSYLDMGHYIVFYPEGSLWWCYEKPRPLLDGAYHYAIKNNVPVVPMFFTFKNLKQRKDGTYKKQFNLHIGAPIYPKVGLDRKQNITYLREENEKFNQKIYDENY